MASPRVLEFDHEGRSVQFNTWLEDLQLYLLSDSKDSLSLFDLASSATAAPPATADSSTRSQWLTCDAAARLAIRNHLPLGECAHFGQHRTAQALYDAVVARYSSPATAALGRLLLPYLFPKLSAFTTVKDLHLSTAETSAVAVGAARGTPRPPFFEGCSPFPLDPSYASATTADISVPQGVGAASASAKRRSSKSKGGRGGGGGSGGGGGGSGSGGGGSSGGGGGGGTVGGSGGSGGGGGGSGGSGGSGGGGTGSGGTSAQRVGSGGGQRQQQQRRSETPSLQQLCEWFLRGTSGGSCPYVIRTGERAGQTCGRLHTQHRCFSRLDDAWHAEFGDDVELPRWADLLSVEGDYYRCVPPEPGINAAALNATESGTLPGTTPAEALHTFTLDSGASRCFFCDSTTLTPLPAPVPVRLVDPSEGPVMGRSSTVLPCPAVPSSALSGLHLPSFSTNLTLLWHHRLGHPSLPCLHGMHSRLLVSGLPRSLPPLSPSPAPPCLPCVQGRQHAAPHSSSFPLTTAPLQTLHMDVWGPARVSGQSREHYFLLVVDDYTRYSTVFLLRSKGQVVDVLIPWICTVRLQLRERFSQDLPVLRLHSDRGGEFSSNLLRDFCRGEGILQLFTLPDSPQQNGIVERRIGLVMEVARTSMIHAATPHFLWFFAVLYAAHQLNLWPRVSLPETSPTLRWTGEVGDASVFRVWGSRVFVHDTPANKLSPRAIPCVFLGFVPDAPGWQFYHPTSRCVFPSQDVTFDESVPFNRLFPYCFAPPPPPPLFLAPGPPPVDPLPPQGPAPSSVSQTGGAEPGDVAPGGAEPGGAEPGGAASEGAESGGAEPQGAASCGGSAGASLRLSLQQLGEWFVQCPRLQSGASRAGGAGASGTGGTGVAAVAGVLGGTATTDPGGARTRGTGAAETGGVEGSGAGVLTESGVAGVGGPGVGGAGAGVARAVDPGGTVRPRPYFPPLQPASPLPAPSPYNEQSSTLTERREPASRPVSRVRTAHHIPRSRPPPVSGTHAMTLRPSSVPLRVPLPAPPESCLPEVLDPSSDRARVTSPTVSRLLATTITDPSFESAAASALVAELLDFGASYRLDYATSLVAESASASPPSVRDECALGTDVLEDRQEDFECLAAAVPHFASMLLAPEGDPDAPDIPTPRSYAEAITGTYIDEVPPPGAKIVDGMWIFRGVDYFQTFSPTAKMTTLRELLHVAAQRDYELHSLDFSTAFLQGSLHEEIWLPCPPGFTESFPAVNQRILRRPVYDLCQAPREWNDTLRTTLAALGFAPSTADPPLFLRTDTSLSPFYILVYVDDLVFATPDTEALTLVKSELQKRHTYTELGSLALRLPVLLAKAHSSVYQPLALSSTFGRILRRAWGSFLEDGVHFHGSGSFSWRSTRSSSVLNSSCEAQIYAGAMAAQELRWLTYLLIDL
ncbi:unnamed protein product [Closterium sp. NIES-53]